MLSISNPAVMSDGTSLPLKGYPNGLKILLDLVGAGPDIARYDFFVLAGKTDTYISPLDDFDLEPFPKESYQNRIRWVWSRKAEQIIMDRPVLDAIVKSAEDLNKAYDSHIQLFGAEAWKKVCRIAIACAGLVCSMSEDGQNLIVTQEHVEWAKNFLISCYDNKLFKLREYVATQRRLVECDDTTVVALQGMYGTHAVMLKQLEMATDMSQRDLQMVSGLEPKEFGKTLNQLVKYDFVTMTGSKVVPTMRFRTAMGQVDRQVFMKKVGER
jgi:hypothetical protein